jgi:hypothetical protein
MPCMSVVVVCLFLGLACVGALLAVYSARAFVIALYHGVIRQEGQVMYFSAAPLRFLGATVHIALGCLAGIALSGASLAVLVRH